jgi:ammonium transporter Rh
MILMGFGFLMTFLRRFTFSALGYTFLLTAVAFQWGTLCVAFAERLAEEMDKVDHEIWSEAKLSVKFLIEGMFAAGTVMISFGATLGVSTPSQLLVMTIMEVFIYSINLAIGLLYWGAVDIGGSMFIHTFGAFFGIAASWVMTPKSVLSGKNTADESSTRSTDTFAMIGTFFLWLLWPSFNGAFAPEGSQHRVIINTVLSLSGSAVGTFFTSALLMGGKFEMVHIQNATLAGGVAIGSAADLVVGPGFAILIGCLSAVLSTLGYVFLSPLLSKRLGLHDTCGVLNLHGIPGIFGAMTGAIAVAAANDKVYGVSFEELFPKNKTTSHQAGVQVGALGMSLLLSIVGGLVTGLVMKLMRPRDEPTLFQDDQAWDMPKDDPLAAKDARDAKDARRGSRKDSAYGYRSAAAAGVDFDGSDFTYGSSYDDETEVEYTDQIAAADSTVTSTTTTGSYDS